jgi:hypothetical protein
MSKSLSGRSESLRTLALSLLVCLCAALPGSAKAQLPSAEGILSTVGFVAFTEGPNSDIIIQRNGQPIAAVIGMGLQTGDEVMIRGNDASVTVKIHGQAAPIVLPRDGRSKTIGTATSAGSPATTLAGFIPESIRRLFTSEKIAAFQMLPRDAPPRRKILEVDPFLPPGHYSLSPDTREVAVIWRGQAANLELLGAGHAVRASTTVTGTSIVQPVPGELQNALRAVRIRGANGGMLQWDIEVAPPPAPPALIARLLETGSNEAKFVHALWLLGMDPASSPPAGAAWRLQGFTELSSLGGEMFPAQHVLEAIKRGEIRP